MSENQSGVPAAPNLRRLQRLRDCKTLGEAFESAELLDRIKQSVPTHVNAGRMLRTFVQATSRSPNLLKCNMRSVLGAMLTCSELGLEPNTPLGHMYLIPFERTKWNASTRTRESIGYDLQLIAGYPGLLELSYRTGLLATAPMCDVVWPTDINAGNRWSFSYGTDAHLRHVPSGLHGEDETPVWAYAHVQLKDGQAFRVMPWPEVMRIRNSSQGYQAALRAKEVGEGAQKPYIPRAWTDAPWFKYRDAMAIKTAFRNLSKWMPRSVENHMASGHLAAAVALDEQQDRAGTVDFGQVIEGIASAVDSGLSDGEPLVEEASVDPTSAFGIRQPDAAAEQTDTTRTSDSATAARQQRQAPDAAQQQKPATRAKRQEVATDGPGTQAGASSPSRAPETQRGEPTTEAAAEAEEPGAPPYWLVNAEGEPLEEKFTDPVAYMTAVANAKADIFPADWEAIHQANSDDLDRAALASAEAAAIYKRDVLGQPETASNAAPAQKEQQASEPAAEEQQQEEGPAKDPLYVDPPAKQDAAGFRGYMQKAEDKLGQCTSGAMIDHFVSVNRATYNDFPGKWRTTMLAAVKAQRDKLSPPPAQGESRRTPKALAEGLKRDIASCKTIADLQAFDSNNAVKSQVQELKAAEGGKELFDEVNAFAKEHAAKLRQAAATNG